METGLRYFCEIQILGMFLCCSRWYEALLDSYCWLCLDHEWSLAVIAPVCSQYNI